MTSRTQSATFQCHELTLESQEHVPRRPQQMLSMPQSDKSQNEGRRCRRRRSQYPKDFLRISYAVNLTRPASPRRAGAVLTSPRGTPPPHCFLLLWASNNRLGNNYADQFLNAMDNFCNTLSMVCFCRFRLFCLLVVFVFSVFFIIVRHLFLIWVRRLAAASRQGSWVSRGSCKQAWVTCEQWQLQAGMGHTLMFKTIGTKMRSWGSLWGIRGSCEQGIRQKCYFGGHFVSKRRFWG